MTVISLKDYAKKKNVSYEAVRKQVRRYEKDLAAHIIMDGRQQFLDEEAVAFLDAKRQKNPVAIIQQSRDEQIEALEDQVKQLLIKTAAQADRISELTQWKADNAVLLAGAEQTRLALEASETVQKALEASRDEYKGKAEEEAQKAQEASERAQKAMDEADTLRRLLEASEAREKALKERSWWERLTRKGE